MNNSKKKTSEIAFEKKRDITKEKTYVSREIETSITILESPEVSVVIDALIFLSKYADVKDENLIHLLEQGIIPKLLALLKKTLPVIRLSLRLLSVLLTKNETFYELDKEEYNDKLQIINEMFINNPDAPVKEFCASILAKMAKSTRVVLLIFKNDMYTPIFQLVKSSTNPVLLANVFELFYNLLEAPTAISILSTTDSFDPHLLIEKMREFDPVLTKLILEIFKRLTYVGVDQIMQLLQQCHLVENLFKVLLDPNRAVYHPIVFEILTNCMQNPITSSYFVESLEFLEFCQWSKSCSGVYLLPIATILEKMSRIPSIKQLLFDLSVEDAILYLLRSKDKKVLAIACSGISNMTSHRYCCEKMLTPVVIREILRLMDLVDSSPTTFNEVAVETIHNFCKRNNRTLSLLEALKGIEVILKYFHAGLANIPPKTYKQILEMIILITSKSSGQSESFTNEFFTTIVKGFQFDHEETNLLCLELMTFCISHKGFRDNFVNLNGPEIMITLLKTTKSKELFKNVLIFIHNNLVYKRMGELFLHQNLALVLKSFPADLKEEVPLVSRCLSLLYSLFLPLKFFETGRLEVCDRFKSRFYLINVPWNFPFPCLEVLESKFMCTRKTIYLVDYRVERDANMMKNRWSTTRRKSSQEISNIQSDLDPVNIACDPYLLDHILFLRKHLSSDLNVEDQVKIVAIFVDAQLCGPRKDLPYPQRLHSFRLHVEALKRKLMSNVIPIGSLKVGFHCERSLLFKALCDKVCIPCTLVRGKASIYWNEVPLLRPGRNRGNLQYYVVDLMEYIGELYPVGSRDANCYCNIN